jgi:hypothetical protein
MSFEFPNLEHQEVITKQKELTSRPEKELLFWQFSKTICITFKIFKMVFFGKVSSSDISSDRSRSFLEEMYVLKYVSKCINRGFQW